MKKCKPIRSPRQAVVLLSVCVALAVVAAVFASVLATYRWAAQIIFLVLLVICIQIVVRYTLTEMEYAVGPNTFTVTKSVGRKETVVCSLELSTAIALLPKAEFKKNDKEKRYGVIGTRFNFNQNTARRPMCTSVNSTAGRSPSNRAERSLRSDYEGRNRVLAFGR